MENKNMKHKGLFVALSFAALLSMATYSNCGNQEQTLNQNNTNGFAKNAATTDTNTSGSNLVMDNGHFETVWEVEAGESVRLPIYINHSGGGSSTTTDMLIDWDLNDSNPDTLVHVNSDNYDGFSFSHTYATAGRKHIGIVGKLDYWNFKTDDRTGTSSATNRLKLKEVHPLVNVEIRSLNSAFADCELDVLNLAGSDFFHYDEQGQEVGGVRGLSGMFAGTTIHNSDTNDFTLDFSNLGLKYVTDMSNMFEGTVSTNEYILNFNGAQLENLVQASNMFKGSNFNTINLQGINFANLETMEGMFENASATEIKLVGIKAPKVKTMRDMFRNSQIQTLGGFQTMALESLKYIDRIFQDASRLISFDLNPSNLDTTQVIDFSKVRSATNAFKNTSALTTVNFNNVDLSSLEYAKSMFENTTSLASLNLDVACDDLSSLRRTQNMFANTALPVIDLSPLDLSALEIATEMFYNPNSSDGLIGEVNLCHIVAPATAAFGNAFTPDNQVSAPIQVKVSAPILGLPAWINLASCQDPAPVLRECETPPSSGGGIPTPKGGYGPIQNNHNHNLGL